MNGISKMFLIESHKTRSGLEAMIITVYVCPLLVFIFSFSIHSFEYFRGLEFIIAAYDNPRWMMVGLHANIIDEWIHRSLEITAIINHFLAILSLQATEVIHPPKILREASVQILQITTTSSPATAISFNPSHHRHLYSYKLPHLRPNSHIIY